MHPNRLARALRNHPENIRSSKLPGGSIVSAVLDRELMTWSDRGGASRIFGDMWSEHCWRILTSESSPVGAAEEDSAVRTVIRLDDNPRIAMQAGRNKLPNPDFLVLGKSSDGTTSVRAIDAKFAIDRIRRTQVSPSSIQDLVELPGSLVQKEIHRHLESGEAITITYREGAFIGPRSLLNDYFFESLTSGEDPAIPHSELHLVDVRSSELFAETDEHELMELFARLDRIETRGASSDILAGMYYLRVASAARWFEQQTRTPLLSLTEPDPVPIDEIFTAAENRAGHGTSAYELILEWSETATSAIELQTRIRDAARLPLRMSELRVLVQRAGFGDDKKRVRMIRGSLERKFMRMLIEEVGEIPAQPVESTTTIIDRIRSTSRQMKPEILRHAETLVERFESERVPSGDGDG